MITLFCVPLLLGTATIGLDLIREMQATQVARDAGRMYSTGIDFTQSSDHIARLAYLSNQIARTLRDPPTQHPSPIVVLQIENRVPAMPVFRHSSYSRGKWAAQS